MEQRANGVVRVDSPDALDRGASAGLAVGHDGQRLQRRHRQPRRIRTNVPSNESPCVRGSGQLDALARLHEPEAALGQPDLKVADPSVHGLAVHTSQLCDLGPRQRPFCNEQKRLELGFGQLSRQHVGRSACGAPVRVLGTRLRAIGAVRKRRRARRALVRVINLPWHRCVGDASGRLSVQANDSRLSSVAARRRRLRLGDGQRSGPTVRPVPA